MLPAGKRRSRCGEGMHGRACDRRLGSAGALPKKFSSSAVESEVWLSVEPTMPNL
jgi:hypothetical protein